jgi:hypothetical protein
MALVQVDLLQRNRGTQGAKQDGHVQPSPLVGAQGGGDRGNAQGKVGEVGQ